MYFKMKTLTALVLFLNVFSSNLWTSHIDGPEFDAHVKARAFELFDDCYYETNRPEHSLIAHIFTSKKKLFKEYCATGYQTCNPNSWFDTKLYQQFFPCQGNPFLDWVAQSSGVREMTSGQEQLVVSMTTHPPRIDTTWIAVESIMRQSFKPHNIVLWLACDDFPDHKIPHSLEALKRRGLDVRFSDINYRVATKLVPSLAAFPSANIVTLDDDRSYNPNLFKALWDEHLKHPGTIVSPHVRRFVFDPLKGGVDYLMQHLVYPDDEGPCHPYGQGGSDYGPPGFFIFEGFSGVLYPPHALSPEVTNREAFRHLTPVADDVWFQTMAILQGTKSVSLRKEQADLLFEAPEIPGTQEAGLFHQHLYANGSMSYRALAYYDLLDKVGLPKLASLQCQTCRRDVPLVTLGQSFPPQPHLKGKRCPMCLNDARKNVLFIGAYDYGNIGDNMYQELWTHFFGQTFNIVCAPDTVRVNAGGDYISLDKKEADFPYDALVIGGGGILKDISKSPYISYYVHQAKTNKKPFFFASVGLQSTAKDLSVDDAKKILGDVPLLASSSSSPIQTTTIDLLRQASFLWARSTTDVFLLRSVLGEDVRDKMHVFPDLGYLYPSICGISSASSHKKYVTLIQTGTANVNRPEVRRMIDTKLKEHHGSQLLVMNWGGVANPSQEKDFPEWDLFASAVHTYYPHAKVRMGNSISGKLKDFRYRQKSLRASDLTPEKAVKKMSKSHFVITGRYHGVILARALGIPFSAPAWSHKINAEIDYLPDPALASKGVLALKNFIENNGVCVPLPVTWNDTTRNMYIDLIAKENPGWSVSFVQAMDNGSLYDFITRGVSNVKPW